MTRNSASNSSVYEHIQTLCKAPVLSEEETRQLLQQYADGSERAKQKLIEHNMRFVVRVARRYNIDDEFLIDCIQEGALGLNRAIEKFDLSTKWTLNTYSERWIRYRIERRIMKDKKVVYVPAHIAKKAHKVQRILQRHEAKTNGAVDLKAVALEANESLDFVRKAFDLNQGEMSLDVPLGGSQGDSEGSATRGSMIEADGQVDPAEQAGIQNLKEWINEKISMLPQKERDAVVRHFGVVNGEITSIADTGRYMGLTRERARQLVNSGLQKIRTQAQIDGVSLEALAS